MATNMTSQEKAIFPFRLADSRCCMNVYGSILHNMFFKSSVAWVGVVTVGELFLTWVFRLYLYNKQDITWPLEDMNFIFSC